MDAQDVKGRAVIGSGDGGDGGRIDGGHGDLLR
jgi:hypothetical protein